MEPPSNRVSSTYVERLRRVIGKDSLCNNTGAFQEVCTVKARHLTIEMHEILSPPATLGHGLTIHYPEELGLFTNRCDEAIWIAIEAGETKVSGVQRRIITFLLDHHCMAVPRSHIEDFYVYLIHVDNRLPLEDQLTTAIIEPPSVYTHVKVTPADLITMVKAHAPEWFPVDRISHIRMEYSFKTDFYSFTQPWIAIIKLVILTLFSCVAQRDRCLKLLRSSLYWNHPQWDEMLDGRFIVGPYTPIGNIPVTIATHVNQQSSRHFEVRSIAVEKLFLQPSMEYEPTMQTEMEMYYRIVAENYLPSNPVFIYGNTEVCFFTLVYIWVKYMPTTNNDIILHIHRVVEMVLKLGANKTQLHVNDDVVQITKVYMQTVF